MPIEIERKFLVNDVTFIKQSFKKSYIKRYRNYLFFSLILDFPFHKFTLKLIR